MSDLKNIDFTGRKNLDFTPLEILSKYIKNNTHMICPTCKQNINIAKCAFCENECGTFLCEKCDREMYFVRKNDIVLGHNNSLCGKW